MKVFISWSGDTSKQVAEAFKEWLPCVINNVDPYISSDDIEKGTYWLTSISGELQTSSFGVVCITKDNLRSPWINFEAGALSKMVSESHVCPFLFDMKPEDILRSPLTNFQMTENVEDDVKKLLITMNKTMGEDGIPDEILSKSFAKWWPDLEFSLKEIKQPVETKKKIDKKTENEIITNKLDEILKVVRENGFLNNAMLSAKIARRNLEDSFALEKRELENADRLYEFENSKKIVDQTSMEEVLASIRRIIKE